MKKWGDVSEWNPNDTQKFKIEDITGTGTYDIREITKKGLVRKLFMKIIGN